MLALRQYQLDGIETVRAHIRTGKKRIVFVLPTGGGKTVVASAIIVSSIERGRRSLFVAHRRELIKQAFAKLVRSGIAPEQIGIVMAGVAVGSCDLFRDDPASLSDEDLWRRFARYRPTAPVQVASIDTLRNRQKPEADLVVIDECHRALAKSYVDLVEAYPRAVVLGLTATPYRADNKGLDALFHDLVPIASPSLLIGEGFLVEPRVWTVPTSALPDLSDVAVTKAGDYEDKALAHAVDRTELVGDIVEHWAKHSEGRRTVVFAASVAHSKHIIERFVAAGIRAEHLDGETPTAERDAILGRLARGETLVVSNCGVLCEGWDQPAVKCLVLARPTKSTGLYLQMAGRILRPWQGVGAVILDHAGAVLEHGFPQDDREFSLKPPKRKKRKKEADAPRGKVCPECLAIVPPATRTCPGCGYEWPPPERSDVEEKAGELVELDKARVDAKRLAAWDDVVADWARQNEHREAKGKPPMRPGWCGVEYRRRFGRLPPKGAKYPTLTDEQRAQLTPRPRPAAPAPAASTPAPPRARTGTDDLEEWVL